MFTDDGPEKNMLKFDVIISLFKIRASICDDCWWNLSAGGGGGVVLLFVSFCFLFMYCLVFIVGLPLSWKTKHSFILIKNHPTFKRTERNNCPHTDRNV